MAEVGAAWQNGYAERVIRTIKEEEIGLSEYRDFQDAYDQIGRFIDEVYARKRIHSSLGYLTPTEFEQQWRVANQARDRRLFSFQPNFVSRKWGPVQPAGTSRRSASGMKRRTTC